MTRFFLASSLILGMSILIIYYYWIKQKLKIRHDNKIKALIFKKYHSNEKEYLRSFIAYNLPLLIDNDLQWIMIWSKLSSIIKTELTYNSIDSRINIKAERISSLEEYSADLLTIGITEFETNFENSIFKLKPNAKIITDALYYIFINIHHLKEFSNHKIITSAG